MVTETGRGDWRRALWGDAEVGLGALVFATLGSAVAWSLHLLVVYFLVALFCTTGWSGGGIAVGVATVPFAGVAAASGIVAWRRWRARGGRRVDDALVERRGVADALLLTGALAAPFFAALIVLEAVSPLFVPLCTPGAG